MGIQSLLTLAGRSRDFGIAKRVLVARQKEDLYPGPMDKLEIDLKQ